MRWGSNKPDIVWAGGHGLLHGGEAEDLQEVVLHHVADDPELVEVSAAALRPERLLEGDGDAGDVVAVPGGAEDHVAEAETDQVLDHLLAQVVVDPVELVLGEEALQVVAEVRRARRVLPERFLHNDPGPASLGHAGGLKYTFICCCKSQNLECDISLIKKSIVPKQQ